MYLILKETQLSKNHSISKILLARIHRAFSHLLPSKMASISNSRWQNHKERSNRSTNNGFRVDKDKRDVSEWVCDIYLTTVKRACKNLWINLEQNQTPDVSICNNTDSGFISVLSIPVKSWKVELHSIFFFINVAFWFLKYYIIFIIQRRR